MVICKFRLWEKSERAPSQPYPGGPPPEAEARVTLKFSAVKDEVFGPYTPSGELSMTVVKSAADMFGLGQECLLTFAPADEYIVQPVGEGKVIVRPK